MKPRLLSAICLAVLLAPNASLAYLNSQFNAVNEERLLYDKNELACSNVAKSSTTSVEVSKNQQERESVAFFYMAQHLAQQGLTTEQAEVGAAGIVGNLAGESSVDPSSDNPAADAGGGGIAQWEGGRWSGPNGLLKFAEARGLPWTDFGLQLDFLWQELTTYENQSLKELKRMATGTQSDTIRVRNSTIIFMLEFERPSIPHTETRIAHGLRIYAANKGKTPAGFPDATRTTVKCAQNPAAEGNPDGCPKNADGTLLDGIKDKGQGEGFKNGPEHPVKIHLCEVYGITINADIAKNVHDMLVRGKSQGMTLGGGGFRTMDSQIELRKQSCGTDYNSIWNKPSGDCSWPVARPGYSNHQMGHAIDFSGIGISERSDPKYKWLAANAKDFGLKNLPSEAWHWSVDGK